MATSSDMDSSLPQGWASRSLTLEAYRQGRAQRPIEHLARASEDPSRDSNNDTLSKYTSAGPGTLSEALLSMLLSLISPAPAKKVAAIWRGADSL